MVHTKKQMNKMMKEMKKDTGKVKEMNNKQKRVNKAAMKRGFYEVEKLLKLIK